MTDIVKRLRHQCSVLEQAATEILALRADVRDLISLRKSDRALVNMMAARIKKLEKTA